LTDLRSVSRKNPLVVEFGYPRHPTITIRAITPREAALARALKAAALRCDDPDFDVAEFTQGLF